jgi:hypothetical protein
MDDDDVRTLAEEGRERGELAVRLAGEVEAHGHEWLNRIKSKPPTSDHERAEIQAKSKEFRRLATQRLDDLEKACRQAADVASTLGQLAADDWVTVLRVQLAPILEGEASTAKALAFLLEVCAAMDAVS